MPAVSKSQQRLFSIAEHNPGALYAKNKALAQLPMKTLHAFAATKLTNLPTKVKASKPVAPPKLSRVKPPQVQGIRNLSRSSYSKPASVYGRPGSEVG